MKEDKYPIGTKVKIIECSVGKSDHVDQVGYIKKRCDGADHYCVSNVQKEDYGHICCAYEVEAIKEFKIGDKVRIISSDNPKFNYMIGEVHEIEIISVDGSIYLKDDIKHLICLEHELELINPNVKGGEKNMTHEFKVGDRVRVKSEDYCREHDTHNIGYTPSMPKYVGKKAIITRIIYDGSAKIDIDVDNYAWDFEWLEPISSVDEIMSKLNELTKAQEKRLTPEEKAMVELGLINDKLEPTKDGFDALQEYLFNQNWESLATQAVKEVSDIKKEEAAAAAKKKA